MATNAMINRQSKVMVGPFRHERSLDIEVMPAAVNGALAKN
jgi:hypothetical protein